jgi:hypothetical protein
MVVRMVRPQAYRVKKYEAKVSGDVVKARIDAMKDVMVEQTTAKFADLQNLEQTVKSIVEPEGVPSILIPHYLNFGRELYRLSGRFTGTTLQNEAKLVFEKWKSRGLNAEILKDIAEVFGIDTSTWSGTSTGGD